MKPRVTVLMATYNDAEFIRESIDSVLAQSDPHFEFVIINDGSTDGTGRIVQSYKDNRIRYVYLSKNVGKGKAMNKGLSLARGKYILELDGDDWLPTNSIEELVKEMNSASANTAVVYGNRQGFSYRNGKWVKSRFYKGIPFENRTSWALRYLTYGPRFYKTAALRKINGWPLTDRSEGRLYEDYQLMLKLLDFYTFKYTPKILYYVRIRPTSVSRSHSRIWKRTVYGMAKEAFIRWGLTDRYVFDDQKYRITSKRVDHHTA